MSRRMTDEEWQACVDMQSDMIAELKGKKPSELSYRERIFLTDGVKNYAAMAEESAPINHNVIPLRRMNTMTTEHQQESPIERLFALGDQVEDYLALIQASPDVALMANETGKLGQTMQELGMDFISAAIQMANDAAKAQSKPSDDDQLH